jgi:hypothetical protein
MGKHGVSEEILSFMLCSKCLIMKSNNLYGLLALSFLCLLSTSFAAQNMSSPFEKVEATDVKGVPTVFEYSDIVLSDPAIYNDEPFSISLTVKNTSNKVAKHEVRLLLKDETAPKGQRKHASKYLALGAGQTETVTFTFNAADLMEALENMPEVFVFQLGEYELGIGYEK